MALLRDYHHDSWMVTLIRLIIHLTQLNVILRVAETLTQAHLIREVSPWLVGFRCFFASPSFKNLSKWGEERLRIPQHQFWYVDDLRRLVTRVRTSCSFVHSFPSSMLKFWGCICQVVLLRFVCIGWKKYKQQYSAKLCFKKVTKNIQKSWQKGSRITFWMNPSYHSSLVLQDLAESVFWAGF